MSADTTHSPTSIRVRRTAPLLRRLTAIAALSEAERRLVEACAEQAQSHRPGAMVAEEGAPQKPRIILFGWACRQRVLSDGRRQLVDLLVPGDIAGFSASADPGRTSLVAVTSLETADASRLRAAALDAAAYPGLA